MRKNPITLFWAVWVLFLLFAFASRLPAQTIFSQGPEGLKPYAAALAELDKSVREQNLSKLESLIIDDAKFIYEETDYNSSVKKKIISKEEYIQRAAQLFDSAQGYQVRRELVSYSANAEGTEGFTISYANYFSTRGKRFAASFREHHHFEIKENAMKIKYMTFQGSADSRFLRRLFL